MDIKNEARIEELSNAVVDETYDKVADWIELDLGEVAKEAMKTYTAYRTVMVLRADAEAYNKSHEMLMDLAYDLSNKIIETVITAKGLRDENL